jgi:hypothetical protein
MSYILHTLNMIGQGPADGSMSEFILGGSDYGKTDTSDIDRKTKARLVPAVKHIRRPVRYIQGFAEKTTKML